MSRSSLHRCLAVFCRERLTLMWLSEYPNQSITVNSDTYHDVYNSSWLGHYDYLRKADGAIVGLAFWAFEEIEPMLSLYAGKCYANLVSAAQLQVFFCQDRDFESETASSTQDFGCNGIFRSNSGDMFITFGIDEMSELSENDIRRITQADADWISNGIHT